VVQRLLDLTPIFSLLNDANATRIQKMMRHQHDATTKIHVEEVQHLMKGAEEAITKI
jgi:hypothetical protein